MAISGKQVLVGALVVELVAQSSKFCAEMAKGRKEVDATTKWIHDHRRSIEAAGRAAAAFGALFVGVMAEATKSAMEFQHGIYEIKTLGVTDSLAEIGDAVLDVSAAFGQETPTVTRAYYDAVSAGVGETSEEIRKYLDAVGMLATVGVAQMADANNLLTTSLSNYKYGIADAERISDVLFATVREGRTTISELAQQLGNVGPTAYTMGLSFEEMCASIAAGTIPLGNTEAAVTGLRSALTNVQQAQAKSVKAAASVGVQFSMSAVKTMGWTKWLEVLLEKTKGNEQALSDMFRSTEAKKFIFALAADDAKGYAESLAALQGSAGTVRRAMDLMSEDAQYQLNRMKQSFNALKIEIGEGLVGATRVGSQGLTELFEGMRKFLDAHPGFERVAVSSGVAIGGLGMAAGTVGSQLGNLAMISMATGKSFGGLTVAATKYGGVTVAIIAGITSWIEVTRKAIGWFDVWRNRRAAAAAEEEARTKEELANLRAREEGYDSLRDRQVKTTEERIAILQQEREEIIATLKDLHGKEKAEREQHLRDTEQQLRAMIARRISLAESGGEVIKDIEDRYAFETYDVQMASAKKMLEDRGRLYDRERRLVEDASTGQLAYIEKHGGEWVKIETATAKALIAEAKRREMSLEDVIKRTALAQQNVLSNMVREAANQRANILKELEELGDRPPEIIEPGWEKMASVTEEKLDRIKTSVYDAIEAMLADLRRLEAEMDRAVGGSWYLDAMTGFVEASRRGFGGMAAAAGYGTDRTLGSLADLRRGLGVSFTRQPTPAPAPSGPGPRLRGAATDWPSTLTVNVTAQGTPDPDALAKQTTEALVRHIRGARLRRF